MRFFKVIIGIVLFIVLICASYATTIFHINVPSENKYSIKVGTPIYKGQFPMPVENFSVVTSKYGIRKDPIKRWREIS